MECAFLLDVVVRERAPILELLTSEDETLLLRGNAFLILNLGLDVVNCVRRLNIECECLSGQGLDKDLHTTAKTEYKMECAFLLDVVVRERAPILELLTSEDE